MFKIHIFFAVAFLAITLNQAKNAPVTKDLQANFVVVKDLDEARKLFSNAKLIELRTVDSGRGQIRYSLGSRVSGDRLVATGSDNASWPSAQDIQLSLQYPRSGSGAVVSYVEVLVNQNSNIGRGYVVSGGIGQRQIAIVIEAQAVTQFSYVASIYGQ